MIPLSEVGYETQIHVSPAHVVSVEPRQGAEGSVVSLADGRLLIVYESTPIVVGLVNAGLR